MKKAAVVGMTEKVINVRSQVNFHGTASNMTIVGAKGKI